MNTQGKKTYQVVVSRPIIQTVIVEVEADGDEQAAEAALDQALLLSQDAWSGEFDASSYGFDVIGLLPKDEAQSAEDPYLQDRCDAIKYLLLRADAESGEGALLFQPWLHDEPALFVADVCQDWLDDVQLLADEGVEGVAEWLEELSVDVTRIPLEVIARLPWIWQQRNKDKD